MKRLLLAAIVAAFFVRPAYADNAININALTAKITAGTSTASVALPSNGGNNIMVSNDSNKTCFIKSGSASVTAATTDLPVLAGSIQRFSIEPTHTYVAAICNTGVSGTVYFSVGPGE